MQRLQPEQKWNDPKLWEKYGKSLDYLERIQVVRKLIPENVSSILDIGCGMGEIINTIVDGDDKRTIVGVDLSREALLCVRVPRVIGRLPHLPFVDRCFDLVMCLEVIEHLGAKDYFASLWEIQRLAMNYVMIGVPYRENLLAKQVICENCRKTFHAEGHLRSFDRSDMLRLFEGFELLEEVLTGIIARRESKIGTWLRQKIGKGFYREEDFVCPCCSAKYKRLTRPAPFNLLSRVTEPINGYLTKLGKAMPYWLICLYRRRSRSG